MTDTTLEAPEGAEGAAEQPSFADQITKDFGPDYGDWVKAKGWDGFDGMMKSHRDVESFVKFPADRLIKLPENRADAAAMGEVWARLGRPDTPQGYEIAKPDDLADDVWDQKKADSFAERSHELGLSTEQARGVLDMYLDMEKAAGLESEQAKKTAEDNYEADMLDAFGGEAERVKASAQRGLTLVPEGIRDNLANAAGSDVEFTRFMAKLGDMMSEGTMPAEAGHEAQSAAEKIKAIEASDEFKSYKEKVSGWQKHLVTDAERAKADERSRLFAELGDD